MMKKYIKFVKYLFYLTTRGKLFLITLLDTFIGEYFFQIPNFDTRIFILYLGYIAGNMDPRFHEKEGKTIGRVTKLLFFILLSNYIKKYQKNENVKKN